MGKKRPKSKTLNAQAVKSDSADLTGVLAAAMTAMAPPVMMKLCRLCEAKDGPFLNIFDLEQSIARKIDILLPFTVSEYDDLPHKICFRCSAKVEELHDFVQKCIRTQESLRAALGKDGNFLLKTKARQQWEEKLNKSNMSNDDICDIVVKQAMKGIVDLPDDPKAFTNSHIGTPKPISISKATTYSPQAAFAMVNSISDFKNDTDSDGDAVIGVRKTRKSAVFTETDSDSDAIKGVRKTRQSAAFTDKPRENLEQKKLEPEIAPATIATKEPPKKKAKNNKPHASNEPDVNISNSKPKVYTNRKTAAKPIEEKTPEKVPEKSPEKTEEEKKPFNINDHVSTIKVNGVGTLYQCHLCNRNFLSREFIQAHGCAKTGVPKLDFPQTLAKVDPPKVPNSSIKFITSKPKIATEVSETNEVPKEGPGKPKPRAGPASRVKKCLEDDSNHAASLIGIKVNPVEEKPPMTYPLSDLPTIQVPGLPDLKNKFRLVPGPNNSFVLVEDPNIYKTNTELQTTSHDSVNVVPKKKILAGPKSAKLAAQIATEPEVIDIDDDPNEGPYPVGLFQTPQLNSNPPPFTTPAMKKHSYTVVQTGNPSKLLLTSKPQPTVFQTYEPPKPKGKRKSRHIPLDDNPYRVTLEDASRPNDQGILNLYNADPLLQPSYVLPSATIQESQISTSTPIAPGSSTQRDSDKLYSCSLCSETFSREKKLLAHIQVHFLSFDVQDKRHRRKS